MGLTNTSLEELFKDVIEETEEAFKEDFGIIIKIKNFFK